MAEIATIARPYAEALFKASSSDLPGAQTWLERIAAIAADPQSQQLADDPNVTVAQVLGLVASVAGALPAAATNFLTIVLENGRFQALPEIARQFRALVHAQSGLSDALVYSAFPIDAAELVQLTAALEKRFGCKLQPVVQVDPDLIGGVRVVVGDEVLDTSVKARLDQMKVALAA